jgi:hypothetical protein
MMLGSIIAQLRDEAFVEQALASLEDLVLLTRVRAAAEAAQQPLADFVAALVGRFIEQADDAAWLSLVSVASRAHDPATASLRRMLAAGLESDTNS